MKNILPAFEFRDDDVMPLGKINCNMVFDVKLDLVRKARFAAGGHQTDPPKETVYSSVVSCDSVRLAFLNAALNDLEILSADVQMPTLMHLLRRGSTRLRVRSLAKGRRDGR
jgi:hypothetical protein